MNLLPPLSSEREASLRASITRVGVLTPILVDTSGAIIDGHNRKRIADELGKPCPTNTVILDGGSDSAIEYSLHANVHHRNLTPDQRKPIIQQLRDVYGWSDRRIADVMGVDEKTVRQSGAEHSAPGGTTRIGKDDRAYPAKRARPLERERRRDAAADLYSQGYARDAICEALGVSHGTIQTDLAARNIDTSMPRETRRGPAPSLTWRDKPEKQKRRVLKSPEPPPINTQRSQEPLYRRSIVLEVLDATEATLRDENAENRLAWDADEAQRAGDEPWFSQARATNGALLRRLESLQRVLDDPAERRRRRDAINETAEPQARPQLRAVGA